MSWRVRIHQPIGSDNCEVYVFADHMTGANETALWVPDQDGKGQFKTHPRGQAIERKDCWTVPSEVLEAIVSAALHIPLPSEAQHRHLQDAIQVRNRLLVILEKINGVPPLFIGSLADKSPISK